MEAYQEILEKIARRELVSAIFWIAIIILLLVIVTWRSYIYFRKMKSQESLKHEKMIKSRWKCIMALICLYVIFGGIAFVMGYSAKSSIDDINKDIENQAYLNYGGEFLIWDDKLHTDNRLYSRLIDVDLDNGVVVYLYMDNFFERLITEEGQFTGTVTYGKNSLIVVDIDFD